jgi:hypothetical protein
MARKDNGSAQAVFEKVVLEPGEDIVLSERVTAQVQGKWSTFAKECIGVVTTRRLLLVQAKGAFGRNATGGMGFLVGGFVGHVLLSSAARSSQPEEAEVLVESALSSVEFVRKSSPFVWLRLDGDTWKLKFADERRGAKGFVAAIRVS